MVALRCVCLIRVHATHPEGGLREDLLLAPHSVLRALESWAAQRSVTGSSAPAAARPWLPAPAPGAGHQRRAMMGGVAVAHGGEEAGHSPGLPSGSLWAQPRVVISQNFSVSRNKQRVCVYMNTPIYMKCI